MQLSDHSELIAVTTELWALLDTLSVTKPDSLHLPPSDTGLHPASIFHADAALAAGFDPEAVTVMSALPYLHDSDPDMGQRAIEIDGSTFPLSYLHFDEDDFGDIREMFSDDNLMPSSAFRLTWQDVNGWEYIYDTKKRLMYVWNPINDDSGYPSNYFHLPSVSPRQALQPLIDSFRGLSRVAAPERTFVRTDPAYGPEEWQFQTGAQYEAGNKVWKAMCGIADIYIECGWDANAVTQTRFRSSEFVGKRAKYLSEVVEPLEEEARNL